jgi:HEAT repeat protein
VIGTERLLTVVLWLSVAVLCIDAFFVAIILTRRLFRHRYYKRKDAARARFKPALRSLLARELQPNRSIEQLGPIRGSAERDALREVLLDAITPESRRRVTALLLHLGYVYRWIRKAYGRRRGAAIIEHVVNGGVSTERSNWRQWMRFIYNMRVFAIGRAEAVRNLGKLTPELAEHFIEEAKFDPSPEVRRANLAGMAQAGSALAYLLPELEHAVNERNGIAVRTIKAAIVRAEIEDPAALMAFLEHDNDRVRFLVVDCVREICAKPREEPLTAHNFPQDMYRLFLEELTKDQCVDVRARSAAVVRHFHDSASVAALSRLMQDDSEFVRLHAVRSCADAYYGELIPQVAARMTDPRWRVREAAVQTLNRLGTRGMRAVAETFLKTPDRYASEQIADELQRSGAIVDIVEGLDAGSEPSRVALAVCRKMLSLGKSSFLAEMLGKHKSTEKRARLMELMATARTPYTEAVLQWIAGRKSDPLAPIAAATLSGVELRSVASGETGGQS